MKKPQKNRIFKNLSKSGAKSGAFIMAAISAASLSACNVKDAASDITSLAADAASAAAELTTTAPGEGIVKTITTTPTTFDPVYEGKEYRLPAYYAALPAIKDVYDGIFKSGAAIDAMLLQENTPYYATIMKHYNVLVTGNDLKPAYLNPSAGVWDFKAADFYVEQGTKMGMELRGHTLVWHSQVPAWWFEGSGEGGDATSDELLTRMREHIKTTVTRYKGKIASWDVVNECVSDGGKDLRRDRENSKWARIVGDLDGDGKDNDFIEQAFIAAREADPDVQLVLNDYNTEQSADKLNYFYNLCKSMLEKDIPLDAAGMQMHIQLNWPPIATIESSIEKLASLKELNPDFKVLVTELDISNFDWSDKSIRKDYTPELERQLAKRYADLYDMFKRQAAKGNLETVITWGFYDGATWLDDYPVGGRKDYPLPFDREMVAKPAFWGIVDRAKIEDAVSETITE
jgi:endo-1,4-beta-xylanase